MKRMISVALGVVLLLAVAGLSFADEPGKLDLKVGDQLFVCGCGPDCKCDTMARKPGKCVCGKPMVQGTVTKVEAGTAMIKTDKGEQLFKTVGLYACACGKGCDCNTISQKAGKCVCGKAMKKVKTTKATKTKKS